ncbi:MAG: AmmECR1 [Acidobacteriaceae bacterium]|nr:AmmECR1 [Acidobacteriaceae bacterium]
MSQQSEPPPSALTSLGAPTEYSPQERKLLLQMAHESILSFLEGREISVPAPSPHLAELRGVFTTLYSDRKLRGCVGFPAPISPVYRAVIETARAAACEDPRFQPISLPEARTVQISISVLSPVQAVSPNEIIIGRHGLVLSKGAQRGLLLPQVPAEHGWDRITFLQQTCLKAGLSPDAWLSGARIEAFTAEVFADPSP